MQTLKYLLARTLLRTRPQQPSRQLRPAMWWRLSWKGLGSATGSTDGEEFSTLIGAGYDFHFGNFAVGPLASLQYTYVNVTGFSEQGFAGTPANPFRFAGFIKNRLRPAGFLQLPRWQRDRDPVRDRRLGA